MRDDIRQIVSLYLVNDYTPLFPIRGGNICPHIREYFLVKFCNYTEQDDFELTMFSYEYINFNLLFRKTSYHLLTYGQIPGPRTCLFKIIL